MLKSISIKDIKVLNRTRKDMGDIKELADNIKEHGLLQAIGVNSKNELIFGARRLEAVKLLGLKEISAKVIDMENVIDGEFSENVFRKEYTFEERTAIAKRLIETYGSNQGKRTDLELVSKCAEVKKGETAKDVIAKKTGFGSRNTLNKALKIVDSGSDVLIECINKGELSNDAASQIAGMDEADRQGASNILKEKLQNNESFSGVVKEIEDRNTARKAEEFAKSLPNLSDRYSLNVKDLSEVLEDVKDEKYNLIITDGLCKNPKSTDIKGFAGISKSALSEKGVCVCSAEPKNTPELFSKMLNLGLEFKGQITGVFENSKTKYKGLKSKIWFVFADKKNQISVNEAILVNSDEDAVKHIVGMFEKAGASILDPFASPSVGVGCLEKHTFYKGYSSSQNQLNEIQYQLETSLKELRGDIIVEQFEEDKSKVLNVQNQLNALVQNALSEKSDVNPLYEFLNEHFKGKELHALKSVRKSLDADISKKMSELIENAMFERAGMKSKITNIFNELTK